MTISPNCLWHFSLLKIGATCKEASLLQYLQHSSMGAVCSLYDLSLSLYSSVTAAPSSPMLLSSCYCCIGGIFRSLYSRRLKMSYYRVTLDYIWTHSLSQMFAISYSVAIQYCRSCMHLHSTLSWEAWHELFIIFHVHSVMSVLTEKDSSINRQGMNPFSLQFYNTRSKAAHELAPWFNQASTKSLLKSANTSTLETCGFSGAQFASQSSVNGKRSINHALHRLHTYTSNTTRPIQLVTVNTVRYFTHQQMLCTPEQVFSVLTNLIWGA